MKGSVVGWIAEAAPDEAFLSFSGRARERRPGLQSNIEATERRLYEPLQGDRTDHREADHPHQAVIGYTKEGPQVSPCGPSALRITENDAPEKNYRARAMCDAHTSRSAGPKRRITSAARSSSRFCCRETRRCMENHAAAPATTAIPIAKT